MFQFEWRRGESLEYVLLSDAKKDLEQTLSKFFLDCKHSIGEQGPSWAFDEVLVSKIMDLLNLTKTLEELGFSCSMFYHVGPRPVSFLKVACLWQSLLVSARRLS